MALDINRSDMKLLTEVGYSGVLRNVDTDLSCIFEALDVWMPDQAAGPIGVSLQRMVSGDFTSAEKILLDVAGSDRKGREEAGAILEMCRTLQAGGDVAGE